MSVENIGFSTICAIRVGKRSGHFSRIVSRNLSLSDPEINFEENFMDGKLVGVYKTPRSVDSDLSAFGVPKPNRSEPKELFQSL